MSDTIAVELFHVFGTWSDGNPKHDREVDTIVKLECHKSGTFKYGNGTCVVWYEGGDFKDAYDTRYEKFSATPESFGKWAESFVRNQVCKTLTVEHV